MNFLNKLERRVGKYAISDLSKYLILGYILGYLIELINSDFINYLTLNPYLILHGQVWRLVTWIIIPPSGSNIIWTVVMLYFYYSVGSDLERTWGTFYYNVYIFMGMLFTVMGGFVIMGLSYIPGLGINTVMSYYGQSAYFQIVATYFSTYYVNMSIFLAFAATFPEVRVLLMFIIPIKVKWLGVAYGALLVVEMIGSNIIGRIVIAASLLNFVVFFLMTRSGIQRMSPHEVKRRHNFNKEVKKARPVTVSKHRCAICGRNSEDNPDVEFRFCSKCNGNYEYCQEHLFAHKHVQ
ncbi:MAG: hypothetical protein LUE96_08120 [Lachnospiraceae bacterium]|nr:hypothetical protein [Lachnospiraceae bacterium]